MEKNIIVTGGTKGIGRAIINSFANEGFNIITCSRSNEDLLKLKKELESLHPEIKVFVQPADLSQKNEVLKFIDFINKSVLHVDILVNNTGFFIPGQIANETEGTLEKMIETNLYSAYNLSRGVLPHMIKEKKGYIFNICSTASITAYTNGGSYCISKFALYGMTKVLREELKPFNIRVTSVLPGATLTESWVGVDLPVERFIKPEDIAESILSAYKLSDRTVVEEILIRPQLGDL